MMWFPGRDYLMMRPDSLPLLSTNVQAHGENLGLAATVVAARACC